jgi:hypothetical protein
VAYVEVVILSEAKDLLSLALIGKQVLRVAQDDNCAFLLIEQRDLARIRLAAFAAAVGCSYHREDRY